MLLPKTIVLNVFAINVQYSKTYQNNALFVVSFDSSHIPRKFA